MDASLLQNATSKGCQIKEAQVSDSESCLVCCRWNISFNIKMNGVVLFNLCLEQYDVKHMNN